MAVARGLGLSDRRQSQPRGEQPQAGRETQPSRHTEGGDGSRPTPQALGQPRRVGKARWEGTATRASSWRHGAAERPQMAMSLMAEQLAAVSGGPAPLQWAQGQSSRETLNPALTGSAHPHTHHTDTHTRGPTRHKRRRPSLPLARVLRPSPFPSHWSRPGGGGRLRI